MKSTIIFIAALFIGCSHLNPVNYTFRSNDRHPIITKDEIRKNTTVGVAILNNEGPIEPYYVGYGIYHYINYKSNHNQIYEIESHDIGSEIHLDEDHKIVNGRDISNKYPNMKYVLYIWTETPHISKRMSRRSSSTTSKTKQDDVWDTVYETSYSVDTETILFDLKSNIELARAVKNYGRTFSYIEEYSELNSNAIVQALDSLSALDNFPYGPDMHPSVNFLSMGREIDNYVYYFLEKINQPLE